MEWNGEKMENNGEYQPSGAGGTRSPPATPHRLQHRGQDSLVSQEQASKSTTPRWGRVVTGVNNITPMWGQINCNSSPWYINLGFNATQRGVSSTALEPHHWVIPTEKNRYGL